jgi:hypothetical protein
MIEIEQHIPFAVCPEYPNFENNDTKLTLFLFNTASTSSVQRTNTTGTKLRFIKLERVPFSILFYARHSNNKPSLSYKFFSKRSLFLFHFFFFQVVEESPQDTTAFKALHPCYGLLFPPNSLSISQHVMDLGSNHLLTPIVSGELPL